MVKEYYRVPATTRAMKLEKTIESYREANEFINGFESDEELRSWLNNNCFILDDGYHDIGVLPGEYIVETYPGVFQAYEADIFEKYFKEVMLDEGVVSE